MAEEGQPLTEAHGENWARTPWAKGLWTEAAWWAFSTPSVCVEVGGKTIPKEPETVEPLYGIVSNGKILMGFTGSFPPPNAQLPSPNTPLTAAKFDCKITKIKSVRKVNLRRGKKKSYFGQETAAR